MQRTFDIKSGLIGGLLALLILSVLGGAPWGDCGCHGRFVMVSRPGHAFVLDTITGQVWSMRTFDERPAFAQQGSHSELTFYDPKLYVEPDPNSPIL